MKPQVPTPCFQPVFVYGEVDSWHEGGHEWRFVPQNTSSSGWYMPPLWYCVHCRRSETWVEDTLEVTYEGDNAGALA